MKKFTSALLASASIMFAASSAHAVIIDDFTTPTPAFALDADFSMNAAGISDSGVERLVSATKTGGAAALDVTVAINANASFFSFSADSGATGNSSIVYENIAGAYFSDLAVTDAFRIEADADLPNGSLTLTVDGITATAVPVIGGGVTQFYDIAFADFAGLDLSDGATITLLIEGANNLDLNIDSIGTVCAFGPNDCQPIRVSEPASLGLLGLGLVGIGAAVRRRKA